jgi:hypothetical protein
MARERHDAASNTMSARFRALKRFENSNALGHRVHLIGSAASAMSLSAANASRNATRVLQ